MFITVLRFKYFEQINKFRHLSISLFSASSKIEGVGGFLKLKINKIAQGDVNIFSQLTFFFIFDIFVFLTGNDASNRLNIIIFVISRSLLVEIDTSLALFQKFYFWRPFWIFSKTRSAILAEVTNRSC